MYAAAEYIEMIMIYGECGRSAREAATVYRERFPNRNQYPDHKTILNAIVRGRETGQVTPNRSEIGGPTRNVRTVENEEIVLNMFQENTTISQRVVSRQMAMSRSSVQRILKENSMHPYHYTRVQQLKPEDYPVRRRFCEWLLNQNNGDPNFLSRVLFSDEAMFGREGCFNAHNWHVWAEENPHALFHRGFQERFSINLWAGLLGDRLVGTD